MFLWNLCLHCRILTKVNPEPSAQFIIVLLLSFKLMTKSLPDFRQVRSDLRWAHITQARNPFLIAPGHSRLLSSSLRIQGAFCALACYTPCRTANSPLPALSVRKLRFLFPLSSNQSWRFTSVWCRAYSVTTESQKLPKVVESAWFLFFDVKMSLTRLLKLFQFC